MYEMRQFLELASQLFWAEGRQVSLRSRELFTALRGLEIVQPDRVINYAQEVPVPWMSVEFPRSSFLQAWRGVRRVFRTSLRKGPMIRWSSVQQSNRA